MGRSSSEAEKSNCFPAGRETVGFPGNPTVSKFLEYLENSTKLVLIGCLYAGFLYHNTVGLLTDSAPVPRENVACLVAN